MKQELRKALLQKRDRIDPAERKSKDEAIRKRLLSLKEFADAVNILFYASFRSEVNTLESIRLAHKTGKNISLPLVDTVKQELRLYEVSSISELVPGYMGIPEPGVINDREVFLKDIDIVIIPGAGFDIKGNRLGYGAGYYDRLLSYESQRLSSTKKHITTLALAYEEQITEKIPAEPHDVKMDMIVTDKRLIYCQPR